MCTILPAEDVKFRVDPAIHSLRKPAYWVNQRDPNGRVSFGSNYAHISKMAMS
ncbi:hypothetical protein M405DRAFT_816486 [Rhizopogon salebrosus TDB-379]|nr:hypothetical protein M405DRAFT_816486 [Rhizopogon salebrosus TDB-379]